MLRRISDGVYLLLGILLLAAFWLQDALGLEWRWLVEAQSNDLYKQCSGFVLLALLLHQWYLSWLQINNREQAVWSNKPRHKLAGMVAPALFYMHATRFGYGYLAFLSAIFFANVLIGLLNDDTLPIKKRWYKASWLFVHITLSLSLVFLVGYHIFITYEYE